MNETRNIFYIKYIESNINRLILAFCDQIKIIFHTFLLIYNT